MNDMNYTYTISNVDVQARCMEIVYESEGRTAQRIGARLPYEGESVEDIVKMYAPMAYWREQETPVVAVEVGVSGTVSESQGELTLDQAKMAKLDELAFYRYAQEVAGVQINGLIYSTDRGSQERMASTHAAFAAGLIQSVDWKLGAGVFVPHNAALFSAVYAEVLTHVQAAFSKERSLAAQVAAAQSIEALEQIVW